MAHLINTTSELQDYLIVSGSLDFDLIFPFVTKSERKFLEPIITKDEMSSIISATNGIKKEVKEILSDAVANFALLMATPFISIDFSNIGITVSNNENIKQAEWWQIKDFKRALYDSAFSAIDEALTIMETNSEDFSLWKDSESYTIFKSLLVNKTSIFNRWFNIKNSRRTFLALKSVIQDIEYHFIYKVFGESTHSKLLSESTNEIIIKIKELLERGVVAMTIAKIADATTFELTDTGLFYRWELLPGEKAKTVPTENLQKIKNQKEEAAINFFLSAEQMIKQNEILFPDFDRTEIELQLPISKFDSLLGL